MPPPVETRKTNNPNATPTATSDPVATIRTQEEVAAEKNQAQPDLAMLLQALQGGQKELLQFLQQGQINPVTGTKSRVNRTVGGDIVDPNAPTGLDWLEAYGPDRASVAARQARVDSYGLTPEKADIAGQAVAARKLEQGNAGQFANALGFDGQAPVNPVNATVGGIPTRAQEPIVQVGDLLPLDSDGFAGPATSPVDSLGRPNPNYLPEVVQPQTAWQKMLNDLMGGIRSTLFPKPSATSGIPTLDPTGAAWNTPEDVRAGLDRARNPGASQTGTGVFDNVMNSPWFDIFRRMGYDTTMSTSGQAKQPAPAVAYPSKRPQVTAEDLAKDDLAYRNAVAAFGVPGTY